MGSEPSDPGTPEPKKPKRKSGWRRPKKRPAKSHVPKGSRPLDHREPVGRPTKYDPGCLPYVKRMAKAGFTEFDVRQALDISERTLRQWQADHPEFLRALKGPKRATCNRVVRALLHRALGYTYESERVFCNSDGEVTRVAVLEHVPPSEGAAKLILMNMDPKNWKDRKSIEHSTPPGAPMEFVGLPPEPEMIGAYYKRLQAAAAAAGADPRPDPGVDKE